MTFQFKIQIKNITKPPVWRRIVVPAQTTFIMFHHIIQEAFGWNDIHMYAFSPGGYGTKPWIVEDDDEDADLPTFEDSTSANTTLLSDIFKKKGQTFTYIYDYGDDWTHTITLEEIDKFNIAPSAKLLAGKGACPPEDCGGPWGYEQFKEVMADEKHPHFQEYKEWLIDDEEMMAFYKEGETVWDPEEYNLEFEKEWFEGLFKITT